MKLRLEILECRRLMSTDLQIALESSGVPFHHLDINQSGEVNALDALKVANELQRTRIPAPHFDANNDGFFTSLDFDCVVDFINKQQQTGISTDFTSLSAKAASSAPGNPKTAFNYWRVGSQNDVSVIPTTGGLGLVGGGLDVDQVFTWMGNKVNGGDFLVIRATGTDAYNPYIQSLLPGFNSVSTLLIPDLSAANDPRVASIIQQAEAIFIAGGDQANYAKYWNETSVETALYGAMNRNVPIGGTSAGLAVLGDFDFTAYTGKTITSNEALVNPYNRALTIDGQGGDGFLTTREVSNPSVAFSLMNLLKNTITDSHFRQRDRLGRLVTFMSRLDADGVVLGPKVRGIGINEQTALLIEPSGMATVVANPAGVGDQRSVYVMEHAIGASRVLTSPLTYTNVSVARANAGASFSLLSLGSSTTPLESYSVSATGRFASRNVAELLSTPSLVGIYGSDGSVVV